MTQAQADAGKTDLLQRATDQANGDFQGHTGGNGGHTEAVSDTSVVAAANIVRASCRERGLQWVLTVAQKETAKNVNIQGVIKRLSPAVRASLKLRSRPGR